MYKLPAALTRLAGELGVEIRLNTEVAKIVIERGRARGVRLASGEELWSDAVVANSDALETYGRLIERPARRIYTDRRLARLEPSCSGFVLLLGVARRYEDWRTITSLLARLPGGIRALFD